MFDSKVLTTCLEIQDLRCLDIVLVLGCLSDARGIHLGKLSRDWSLVLPTNKA